MPHNIWMDLIQVWTPARVTAANERRQVKLEGIRRLLALGPETAASLRDVHGHEAEALVWVLVSRRDARRRADGLFELTEQGRAVERSSHA